MRTMMGSNNDRLIAIYGHELRGHIAPISNAAQLLRRSKVDPATASTVAAIIERQVAGMARLVDGLIACSQDLPAMRCLPTTVETIVTRGVEMVAPVISSRRQLLSVRMPAEAIAIKADELWLTLALRNVIGNAAKYTAEAGKIEIEVQRDLAAVEIRVRDTGNGLEANDLETIFELYTRVVQKTGSQPPHGLGVGLHLAKCIVSAHRGSIRAVSAGIGQGSTFVIRLPCSAAGSARL